MQRGGPQYERIYQYGTNLHSPQWEGAFSTSLQGGNAV